MHRVRPLTFLPLLALLACTSGPGDTTPDAGEPTGPDDAYFGLVDKTCLHFANTHGVREYTVEVRLEDGTAPGAQVPVTGVRTYHLIHRFNGFVQKDDWLEVTQTELKLHRRQDASGTGSTLLRYTPPPIWLEKGLDVGQNVDSQTTAKATGGLTGDRAQTFSTVAFPSETLTAAGHPVEATKYTITITDPAGTTTDKVWLAPNVGLVKLDPPGTDLGEEVLVETTAIAGTACVD